jgi:hypothetical protein
MPCAIALVAYSAACSGSSSSTSTNPTGLSGGGTGTTPTCRTYPTAAAVKTTAVGVSMNALLIGAFNSSSKGRSPCRLSAAAHRCVDR